VIFLGEREKIIERHRRRKDSIAASKVRSFLSSMCLGGLPLRRASTFGRSRWLRMLVYEIHLAEAEVIRNCQMYCTILCIVRSGHSTALTRVTGYRAKSSGTLGACPVIGPALRNPDSMQGPPSERHVVQRESSNPQVLALDYRGGLLQTWQTKTPSSKVLKRHGSPSQFQQLSTEYERLTIASHATSKKTGNYRLRNNTQACNILL